MSKSSNNQTDVYISAGSCDYNLDDIMVDSIDLSGLSNMSITTTTATTPNYSIAAGTGGYNGTYTISGVDYSNPGLKVTGDAEFEGDVKIQGKSIVDLLEAIEQRLAILQPDPAKLEKYAALKEAYEHYKTLEALCRD